MPRLPLLVITPHSSGHVPQDVLREMLGEDSLDLEQRRRRLHHLFGQGDPYTDLIFDVPGARAVHAMASRFVVDLNRDRDAGGRNGVVKLTDFDAGPLYPPGFELSPEALEERLQRYWDPFHSEVARVLGEEPIELLLDGHSMTPVGPAIGPDGGRPRPALTLMTGGDEDGEPLAGAEPSVSPAAAWELREAALRCFAAVLDEAEGEVPREVALNRPWSVDEISRRYHEATGVAAFGLEVNRALYLEGPAGNERPRPERIRSLQRCLVAFAEEALAIVRKHPLGGSR